MERLSKYNPGTRLGEMTESEKRMLFIEIMSIASEFKGIEIDDKKLKVAAQYIIYFSNKSLKNMTIAQVIQALEMGMSGQFEKASYTKVSADLIISWLSSMKKLVHCGDGYDPAFERGNENAKRDYNPSPLDRLYAEAVLLRTFMDPGGKLSEEENITLDEVVEGIRKGMNVFNGEAYSYKEMQAIYAKATAKARKGQIKSIGELISMK